MRSIKQFFKGFKKGMHNFGQNIAMIINSALLLVVYVIGVGTIWGKYASESPRVIDI